MSTKIQWASDTLNFLGGCTFKSKGCFKCYALKMSWRLAHNPNLNGRYEGLVRKTKEGYLQWTNKIKFFPSALELPFKWKKPRVIFVNSMSDMFHKNVKQEWIDMALSVFQECDHHIYKILTKRPEDLLDRLPKWFDPKKNPHIWFGTSVEDQDAANERLPLLWEWYKEGIENIYVSFEPLLGRIELATVPEMGYVDYQIIDDETCKDWVFQFPFKYAILGGESGTFSGQFQARYFDLDWLNELIWPLEDAGVDIFIKQLGTIQAMELGLKNRKGGDMNEWPKKFQIRNSPFPIES